MMSAVIRVVGCAPIDMTYSEDRYLKEWDVNAHDGRGMAVSTPNMDEAHRFADAAEAMRAWREQSTVRPLRDDGEPNRPLTAFTVEIVNVP